MPRHHPGEIIGRRPPREPTKRPDWEHQERPEAPPPRVIGEPRFFTDNPDIPSLARRR